MLGRDRLGLGQWVTPRCRVLAGKDGTVMVPQQMLVPCEMQVGDKAETRSPKPLFLLNGPPGCAGEGLADEISNPAGTNKPLYEGRRGLAAGSHSSNSTAPLLGVFCASPSQIRRFVPRDVLAVPCGGLVTRGQVVAQGEQVPFRGHRFIHSLQSRISDWMYLGLPVLHCSWGGHWRLVAFGGVSG